MPYTSFQQQLTIIQIPLTYLLTTWNSSIYVNGDLYELNVWVPPKVLKLKPRQTMGWCQEVGPLGGDQAWGGGWGGGRGGGWGVVGCRHEGGAPMMGWEAAKTTELFLSAMWGPSKKIPSASQEKGLHQNPTLWHPELGRPDSRTVRNYCLLIKPPSLWTFIIVTQGD